MTKNLIEEIKKLRIAVVPRSDWKAENRAVLLRSIYAETINPPKVSPIDFLKASWQLIKIPALQPAIVMGMVLVTFVASSLTINAAFYSLPGDNLYPVKIALENTHVSLVGNQERKADLRIEFVQRRVDEINRIANQPNVTPEEKERKIKTAVREFRQSAAAVNQELTRATRNIQSDSVNVTTREQTVRMAITVTGRAEELAKSFEEKVNNALAETSEESLQEAKEVVAEVLQNIQLTRKAVETQKEEEAIDKTDPKTGSEVDVEMQGDKKLEAQSVKEMITEEVVE